MQAGAPSGSGSTNQHYRTDPVPLSAALPITRPRRAQPKGPEPIACPLLPQGASPPPPLARAGLSRRLPRCRLRRRVPRSPSARHSPGRGSGTRSPTPRQRFTLPAGHPGPPCSWVTASAVERRRRRGAGGGGVRAASREPALQSRGRRVQSARPPPAAAPRRTAPRSAAPGPAANSN